MHGVAKINKYLACIGCVATLIGGCGGQETLIQDVGAEGLYERGHEYMMAGAYPMAIQYFQQLEAGYPFSNATRQAQLDLIFLYEKTNQPDAAIDAAEEFERENPTHPRIDYCLWMKGRVYFDNAPNILERLFKVDMTMRPPKDSLLSFETFEELLRRFPDSRYSDDARQRMVYLRNRLATYENHVARYYMERGAYVAAINRGKYALEHYSGAPELENTLVLLIEAYQALGMLDLAADSRRVLNRNFGRNNEPALSSVSENSTGFSTQ